MLLTQLSAKDVRQHPSKPGPTGRSGHTHMTDTPADREGIAKRRVPCMVAFLSPFRIVDTPDLPRWDPGIDAINRGAWDYAELHRLVGGVDVGLPGPYHMVVTRDGGVGLPTVSELQGDQQAVEFVNRCFAALLLGGVYCEAISLDGLDFGSILDWTYLRVRSSAPAGPNRFHRLARLCQAPPLEAIHLLAPRVISMSQIDRAMRVGRGLLDVVPEVSPEFLLKGTTAIARRNWSAALSNLWIVVEQATSHLWESAVLTPARQGHTLPGRVDQLSDLRTWTIATRHELLHQTGILSRDVLEALSVARKARNSLVHKGRHPSESDATAAYSSVLSLLNRATGTQVPIPLEGLDLADHTISDPFLPRDPQPANPTHWMAIPKLPGEADSSALKQVCETRPPEG